MVLMCTCSVFGKVHKEAVVLRCLGEGLGHRVPIRTVSVWATKANQTNTESITASLQFIQKEKLTLISRLEPSKGILSWELYFAKCVLLLIQTAAPKCAVIPNRSRLPMTEQPTAFHSLFFRRVFWLLWVDNCMKTKNLRPQESGVVFTAHSRKRLFRGMVYSQCFVWGGLLGGTCSLCSLKWEPEQSKMNLPKKARSPLCGIFCSGGTVVVKVCSSALMVLACPHPQGRVLVATQKKLKSVRVCKRTVSNALIGSKQNVLPVVATEVRGEKAFASSAWLSWPRECFVLCSLLYSIFRLDFSRVFIVVYPGWFS